MVFISSAKKSEAETPLPNEKVSHGDKQANVRITLKNRKRKKLENKCFPIFLNDLMSPRFTMLITMDVNINMQAVLLNISINKLDKGENNALRMLSVISAEKKQTQTVVNSRAQSIAIQICKI